MKYSLALVGLEGGINLGLICRLADNFDVEDIFLINPNLLDEDYDLAEIFASRAGHRLESLKVADNLDEILSNFDLVVATTGVRSSSPPYRSSFSLSGLEKVIGKMWGKRICLVFGRESVGLTPNELRRADIIVSVQTSNKYPSMNIATAVAAILSRLYEAKHLHSRQPSSLDINVIKLLERYIYNLANRAFSRPDLIESIVLSFRRVFYTQNVSESDLKLMLTFFRRLYSLHHANKEK